MEREKAKETLRFDVAALRNLAGSKVFARGEEYHRDGQVRILALESQRVLAQVAGSEIYRTEITGSGTAIGGMCSCRAFADWGFCKHMVATALAANAAGDDPAVEAGGALSRIREHLKAKGVDALVAMILELAERDAALFRRLDATAAALHADDKTLGARLRKAIDAATRRSAVDYWDVPAWAEEVSAALDPVADLAPGARAGLALELAERAIDRIASAMEGIDDSDGHCIALLHRARATHLAAACAARPDPLELARDLFAREMVDDYDIFHNAAWQYDDALGEAGLAEYRRLAAEAWKKLPARGTDRERREFSGNYDRLKRILDAFAEEEGDVEARIALRTKDLSSARNYQELAEFCLSNGREAEALRWAEEGLWRMEEGPLDEGLVLFAVERLACAGRKTEAEAHLCQAFEKRPSLDLYQRLKKLGGSAAGQRAIGMLERQAAGEQRTAWQHPGELLVRVLIEEEMFDAAWAAVGKHRASPGLCDALAQASEATHPREALAVYTERVERLANAGNNAAYAEAAVRIARMATLRSAAEQTAYLADFKLRFGRKRNLMKLLG